MKLAVTFSLLFFLVATMASFFLAVCHAMRSTQMDWLFFLLVLLGNMALFAAVRSMICN